MAVRRHLRHSYGGANVPIASRKGRSPQDLLRSSATAARSLELISPAGIVDDGQLRARCVFAVVARAAPTLEAGGLEATRAKKTRLAPGGGRMESARVRRCHAEDTPRRVRQPAHVPRYVPATARRIGGERLSHGCLRPQ